MTFIQKFHWFEKLLKLFQEAGFVKAFLTFLAMWDDGFFPSENTHVDYDGVRWGFYRFNHRGQFALCDIDFQFGTFEADYAHIHGGDYRLIFDKKHEVTEVQEQVVHIQHKPVYVDQKEIIAKRICKMNDIATQNLSFGSTNTKTNAISQSNEMMP